MGIVEYQPRTVLFHGVETAGDWSVKVHKITFKNSFAAEGVLRNAIEHLPEWLNRARDLPWPNYRVAFLIVHEGRDGVWTLINWWIEGGLLQSTTFYTGDEGPDDFTLRPTAGSLACVWELAVIAFERERWVQRVLSRSGRPELAAYLNDGLNQTV